jgi:hypothetical protein
MSRMDAIARLLREVRVVIPARMALHLAEGHEFTPEILAYLREQGSVPSRPDMGRDELMGLARQSSLVRWHPSGIVERITLVNERDVRALRVDPETGKEEPGTAHFLARRPVYHCAPIEPPVEAPAPQVPVRSVAWARLRG